MRCHPTTHVLYSTPCSTLYAAVALMAYITEHVYEHTILECSHAGILHAGTYPCTTPDHSILDARSWCVHSPAACMQYTMALAVSLWGTHAWLMRYAAARIHHLLLSWYPVSRHMDPHSIRHLGIPISMICRSLVSMISP